MSDGFQEAIGNGKLVLTAECAPPRGAGSEGLAACAKALAAAVDAVCARESEDGVRLASLAACSHIAAAGAEPVMHLLTRDANRIALQSMLLGAASMGIKNVFCTTGRHQTLTTSRSARGVFDLDPVQLLQVADALRKEGRLTDGQVIDAPLDLVLGTDANPSADPPELQAIALQKAVDAGADFVITYPVFNLDRFNVWMSHARERGLDKRACIIASVMPVTSTQDAVRLAEKYPSLDIGDEVAERLDTASDQKAAGIHLAAETAKYMSKVDGVRGIHLMTGGDHELALEILKASGLSRN
jgi:methylenetetrahydrofolate reductase (NADPH)